jgi:hypothetical protein
VVSGGRMYDITYCIVTHPLPFAMSLLILLSTTSCRGMTQVRATIY